MRRGSASSIAPPARSLRAVARCPRGGYTLVALVVFLVVLNIAVAVALPWWSKAVQRDAEAELVFRGLQYAEAIRVFQERFGRPPNSLRELVELEPRSIRKLWKDPLSESGEWEPLVAGSGSSGTDLTSPEAPARGASAEEFERALESIAGRDLASADRNRESGPSDSEREAQSGPIEGVRPTARGDSMRAFLGQTRYEEWEFRSQLLAAPQVTPEGVPRSPRIDPDALGRPFPPWLRSVPGSPPHPGGGSGDEVSFQETESG